MATTHETAEECIEAERYLDDDAAEDVTFDGEEIVVTRRCPECDREYIDLYLLVSREETDGEIVWEA